MHDHDHELPGHSHAHDVSDVSDGRLLGAIALNTGLTLVEVTVGVLAGSLSLVADAVHNLNDAAALLIAYVSRRIARRGADQRFTFGYRRAELIGAMINLTTLVVIGLYLVYEAIERWLAPPEPIHGLWVVAAASVALVVDLVTAALLWRMSQGNLNVRAAFIHNVSDAAASLAVLLGGLAIWKWSWTWVDPLLALIIAGTIIVMSAAMLRRTASILMENAPPDLDLGALEGSLREVAGVADVHHIHVWELDESHTALEAHVVLDAAQTLADLVLIKGELRGRLRGFGIEHSTLEFETYDEVCPNGVCDEH